MMESIPLGDILSVTTGFLVSRDHVAGIYRVCDFMTGESNFTHQLPRVSRQITPEIHAQHPALATVNVPDEFRDEKHVMEWLEAQEARFGTHLALTRVENSAEPIDPLVEMAQMRGDRNVIVVGI